MGCISSKIATRSRSFREELSQSLQRRVNGFPVLEDILIPKNAGDQLLALVCTANTVAKKLQNGTCATDSSPQEDLPYKQTNHETINAKELMADLEEEEEEEEEGPKQQPLMEQHDEGGIASRSFWQDANGNVADDGGILSCSRSIRTVEEYDALVQASNRSSQAEQDIDFGHSTRNANELLAESVGSCFRESSAVKEDDGIAEEWKEASTVDDRGTNPAEAPVVVVFTIEDGNETTKKGSRRKAKAKELGNLSIPTTIDFPVPLESSGDWTQLRGEELSNGDYATPRFGSFGTINSIKCSRECSVFDPELLASLEEAMKQMTEEGESILQQIVESLEEEEGVLEEEDKECITGQIQGPILHREHGAGF